MATKPALAASYASLPSSSSNNNSSKIFHISVKCIWWNTTKTLHINLIFNDKPLSSTTADEEEEDDDDTRKYSLCSLLLQLGKAFHIQPPPYAPSPRLSSMFNRLLECWSLQRVDDNAHDWSGVGGNNKKKQTKHIERLSEIHDGDELLFSFGDYFQKMSSPSNNGDTSKKTDEVDLLELLPRKYNLVTLEVINNNNNRHDGDGSGGGKYGQKKNNTKTNECVEILSSSSDDEVEDVTDMYVKKSRSSPEVIEVEDASSSSDDGSDWEKDEYGNLRRNAAYFEKKCRGTNNSNSNRRDDDNNGNHENYGSVFDSVGDNSDVYSSDDDYDDDSSIEDVTDIMLAKKQEEEQKLMKEAELLETDSEEEEDTKKKRKRKKNRNTTTRGGKRRKVQISPIAVLIEDQDVPDCPGASLEEEEEEGDDNQGKEGNTADTNDNDVDLSIKQRIIKLLNTGLHNESNEHEAKNAMKLARRLLDRHNLDQAKLLKERGNGSLNDFSTTNDKGDGSTLHGGIVTVNILNRKKTVPLSSMPRWLENLIAPVTANFRVDAFMSFSKAKRFMNCGKCSVSFFGIKTNAQLAAYAFKTAAERIAFMTVSYDPPRSKGMEGRSKQASRTRTARLSYALGIVAGLHEDVKRGLKEEEQKRQEDLRRARNGAKTGEAYQEDVDCNDEGDEIQQQRQEGIPVEEKLQQLETENEARLALVDCNKKIAEDVLKVRGSCVNLCI